MRICGIGRALAALLALLVTQCISVAPVLATGAMGNSYRFYESFDQMPDYIDNTPVLSSQNVGTISVENGRLRLERAEGWTSNYGGWKIPASALRTADCPDDKLIIEYDYETTSHYHYNQILVNGTALVWDYHDTNSAAALTGTYRIVYDKTARTITGYPPLENGMEKKSAANVPADSADGLTLGFGYVSYGMGQYVYIDNVRISPYRAEAELFWPETEGSEPNEIGLELGVEIDEGVNLADYLFLDGEPMNGTATPMEDGLRYTLSFVQPLDYGSSHTLEIRQLPNVLGENLTQTLPFTVRNRGLLVKLAVDVDGVPSGTCQITADVRNEVDAQDPLILTAALYDAYGMTVQAGFYTLPVSDGVSSYTIQLPDDTQGCTFEAFAIRSLTDFTQVGSKLVCDENGNEVYGAPADVKTDGSQAVTTANVENLYETVIVTLPEGTEDQPVVLAVLRPGETELTDDTVYYWKQQITENGQTAFAVKMPDQSAAYPFFFGAVGETVHQSEFRFFNAAYKEEAIDAFNRADAGEMAGVLEDYGEVCGIVQTEPLDDAVKRYVYQTMPALREEKYPSGFTRADEIKETYQTALFLAQKGDGDVKKFIDIFQSDYGFDADVFRAYTDIISQKAANDVCEEIKAAAMYDLNAVRERFASTVILQGVAQAENYSQTRSLLDSLGEKIGYDAAAWKALSTAEKSTAAKSVSGKSYGTLSALAQAVDAAVKATNSSSKTSIGSTGTGGYGRGGALGGSVRGSGEIPSESYSNDIAPKNDGVERYTTFSDMAGCEWALDTVEDYYDRGIINGKGDGLFAPGDPLTRAEMAKVLALALKLDTNAGEGGEAAVAFADLPEGHWAYPYVEACRAAGLVNGIEEDLFGTDQQITREMLITMLWRAAGKPAPGVTADFKDIGDASEYARDAIRYYKALGAVSGTGDNHFAPGTAINRAEAVVMIANCLAAQSK